MDIDPSGSPPRKAVAPCKHHNLPVRGGLSLPKTFVPRQKLRHTPVRARQPSHRPAVAPVPRTRRRGAGFSLRRGTSTCSWPRSEPMNSLALRSLVPHQCLKARPDRFGIRGRAARLPRLPHRSLIPIEGLLHTYVPAIPVWPFEPYHSPSPIIFSICASARWP